MRRLGLLLIFTGLMLPAPGEKRINVDGLDQTLAAAPTGPVTVAQLERIVASGSGQTDGKLADQLAGLQLTQRLSSTSLARLQSMLPGPQSQQELSILAARSSFLDLPAAELPATPPPNVASQRQIMAAVVTYVTQSTRKLPDFIATRQTRTFEDRPAGLFDHLPLHFASETSADVVYRNGEERATNARGKKVNFSAGLVSWGEFGPILTTVLLDAANSQLTWSHWEQDASGPVAVFRYVVPEKKSHYQIQICCGPTVGDLSEEVQREQAPYHGEMSVDPSTGAILRITVIADMAGEDPLVTASIAVEYGPVDIGGKTYICPIRSEAIAQSHQTVNRGGAIPSAAVSRGPIQTRINEVSFLRYHIYRGESRILTDAEAAQMTGKPLELPSGNSTEESKVTPAAAETQPNETQPAQPTAEPQPVATRQPAPADTSVEAGVPPTMPVSTAHPPDIPVFRTTSRQVLVDVVVDKKNGDPVSGLPQSDFSIAEDGKPQSIDFFEEHSAAATAPVAQPAMPPLAPGAVSNVPKAAPSAGLYVFLLDSLNTEPQDQVFIHGQVLSFLNKMDPGTQVAVFSLGTHLRLLHGFTSDSAALVAAVNKKSAEREAMAQNRSDNTDDAAHIAKLQSMRASPFAIEARQAADTAAHAYSFGARSSMTFEALSALARYLQGIPGRKNLVWFASSFPVVFFPTPAELDQLKNNPNLPGYVNRVRQTADLFTLSKIAVYPVSGAGVMNSKIGMADSPDAGSAGGAGHFGTSASPTSSLAAESMQSASATASMEQLAASTGGRAFTTNDIGDALHKIISDSAVYYTLGYAPSNSATDGGFRRIDVKVSGGRYKLGYRQGYNANSAATDGAPPEEPLAALLQLGMPAATGILYGVSAVPGTGQDTDQGTEPGSEAAGQNPQVKGPLTRYTLSFTVRAQDVFFGQAPDGGRIAKLLIGVKAYGKDGSALNWQANREALQLDAAHYQAVLQSGIPITLALDLPANTPAQFVTAVYDWNSNKSGTLEIPLQR